MRKTLLCGACLVFLAATGGRAAEPWSTYRGNAERTGHTDGKPGPKAPKILWVQKSMQHHVAAPVPVGDRLLVSGLGAFNVSTFSALSTAPTAAPRTIWTKTTPYLRLPTVSSPALLRDTVIFGDGMHQTDGAILHCLRQEKGLPLWQLSVPGTLVHLEGSPTVVGTRVLLGGGAAGVLCLDAARVSLDGKEMDLLAVQKIVDAKWSDLMAQYEKDKKKDPDFAVPPSEDQLPRPAPKKLWQVGAEKWHVDAPVTVVGDRVYVASAFLDKEKVGDRALHCLDLATGKSLWRTPLTFNPWGGATVCGETLIVTGSSIGYDTKALANAHGEIVALDRAQGTIRWRKPIKGGIVSCAACAQGAAVITATDGKVRAFDVANGELRWYYEAKTPLFAPPAVAGDVVYAGDLKGVVHALDLARGTVLWTVDLGTDPAVMAPGMIYGGPVVHGGRVFLATCNLEGPFAGKSTVIIAIGEK